MKDTILFPVAHPVYPGEYVPLPGDAESETASGDFSKGTSSIPYANVSETDEAYCIDIAVPGLRKEDTLIFAVGNRITVCAAHYERKMDRKSGRQVTEFDYSVFKRQIELPGNLDAEFVTASYAEGILHLYAPRCTNGTANTPCRIAIY